MRLRLQGIPGVGERLAAQLSSRLGGEEAAVEALLDARLPEAEAALGSRRRALRLIRSARAAAKGYTADTVTATSDASALLQEALSSIARRAGSEPARVYIETLSPAPSHALPALEAETAPLRALAAEALEEGWPLRGLRDALKSLTWPRRGCGSAKLRRLVLLDEPPREELRRLLSKLPGLRVERAREPPAPEEVEAGDAVYYDPHGVLPPGAPRVERLEPWSVAPEAVIEELRCNRGIVEALARAWRLHPRAVEEAARLLGVELADTPRLAEEALSALEALESGRLGRDYEEAREKLERLEKEVTDLEVWLNEEAKRRLEQRELRLTAAELLGLIDAMSRGEVPVPPPVAELFEELALEAENRLAERLGLGAEEAALIRGLVEPRPGLPLEVSREPLERLRRHLARRLEEARYAALTRLARPVAELLPRLPSVFRLLRALDAAQAMASFSAEAGHRSLTAEPGSLGVGFIDGVEIGLLGRPGVQPVSYSVGCTSYRPEGTSCERVVVLTGANSGGKTTLLRLVAETVLLAQSGLPVPARSAWLGPFDRVYFISKPTGMLSAGALETLLKRLAAIVAEAEEKRVLVLVDELEAVTEAQAAARIVAAFAEELASRRNAVAVIVSHMAEEILSLVPPEARKTMRIDGIEARGLDENYNLIVDRSPRYRYLARSTPELVVRKLAATTRTAREKRFYDKLLSKMAS